MARSRASAKQAGARFEREFADYMSVQLDDDRIDRRVKSGAADKGDILGLRTISGGRIVAECKNYGGQFNVGAWLNEAEIERGNDDAVAGIVVAKRRGVTHPGSQVVFMTVDDFIAILTGSRPDLRGVDIAPEVILSDALGYDPVAALADLTIRSSE